MHMRVGGCWCGHRSNFWNCRLSMATRWVDCWEIQSYACKVQPGRYGFKLIDYIIRKDWMAKVHWCWLSTFSKPSTIDNNIWDIWCKMGPHTLILMHGCNMLGWDEPKLTSILHLEQGKDLDVNQSPFQTSKANNHWCWNVEQIIR